MGRYSTSPHLYDECLQLSTTMLKEYGYLNENQLHSGVISWTSIHSISKITIRVNTFKNIVTLDYSVRGAPKKYDIKLVTMNSNIGDGKIWFFICPFTNKRCRKLYLGSEYFAHRTAYTGMYSGQTESKWYRKMSKLFRGW